MRVLVIRPDRIGDVVLSSGIPREMKKAFPNSFVAVLVRNYTKDIFKYNPNIDEVILLDEENSFASFLKMMVSIRKFRFTHSLNLLPTEKINYLLFFSGIPFRVGVGHKFYQAITFTKYVSRNKYIPLRHEADYCMDLARKIGVVTDNITPQIYLDENEIKYVKNLRSSNSEKLRIGIHVSSGNSAPNMLVDEYKKLILELLKFEHINVIVTDNFIDEKLKDIDGIEFPNVNNTLRDSILQIASLDILISASTGPMHIASALGIKTLSVFCPLTACSPKLWGPLGNGAKNVVPEESYCKNNCPQDPKKCNYVGSLAVNADSLLHALGQIFNFKTS